MKMQSTGVGMLAALAAAAGAGCGAKTGLTVPCVAEFRVERASVMLVIDRSGSMYQRTEDDIVLWTALVESTRSVLPQLDGVADVGVTFFPSRSAVSEEDVCLHEDAPALLPTPDWREAQTLIDATRPGGGTPTFEALRVAYGALQFPSGSRRRVALLVTDGGAGCNGSLDLRTCVCPFGDTDDYCRSQSTITSLACLDADRVVSLVADQFRTGVRTLVLGINARSVWPRSTQLLDGFLDRTALAGGGDRLYRATRAGEIGGLLRAALLPTTYCRLRVQGPVREDSVLTAEGARVAFDRTAREGWSWSNAARTEVSLNGAACETAMARQVQQWRGAAIGRCFVDD
jgi:hypothetical protein